MSEGDWVVVRRGKQGRRKNGEFPKRLEGRENGEFPKRPDGPVQDDEEYSEEAVAKLKDKLASRKNVLRAMKWWGELSQQIRNGIDGRHVTEMNCLGIGSFQENRSACYQLACTLLIRESFASDAKYTMADPVMNKVDQKIASDLGFRLIKTEMVKRVSPEEPKLVAISRPRQNECVLWIMPHCPLILNDAVLAKTSTFGHEGMVFFWNVLSDCDDVMSPGDRERCASLNQLCVDKRFIERIVSEPKDKDGIEIFGAFNDLSVTTIAGAVP